RLYVERGRAHIRDGGGRAYRSRPSWLRRRCPGNNGGTLSCREATPPPDRGLTGGRWRQSSLWRVPRSAKEKLHCAEGAGAAVASAAELCVGGALLSRRGA